MTHKVRSEYRLGTLSLAIWQWSNGLGKHNGMGPNGNVYRTTGTRHRWDTTDVSRGTTRDTAAIPEATRDRTIR